MLQSLLRLRLHPIPPGGIAVALVVVALLALLMAGPVAARPQPAPAQDYAAAAATRGASAAITTDTFWSGTHVITANVTVADGARLTIAPGTTVQVDDGRALMVYGELIAVGTAEAPIRFIPSRPDGRWQTIEIGGGSVPTDSNGSRLSHLLIERAGSGMPARASLRLIGSTPAQLDHLTIRNGGGGGLFAQYTGAFALSDSLLEDNAGNGLDITYGAGGQLLTNLTVRRNAGDGIALRSTDSGQILTRVTVQENGGHAIYLDRGGDLLISDSTLSGNGQYGIFTYLPDIDVTLRNSGVTSNAVAARLSANSLIEAVDWSGNSRNEIEWIGGTITGDRVWAQLPGGINTYRIVGNVGAVAETTLTVTAGVQVLFEQGRHLDVNGGLVAVGTVDDPIRFGPAQSGAVGFWRFLEIGGGVEGSRSRLSHVIVEGAGYGFATYPSQAGLRLVALGDGDPVMLDHLTIRNNAARGMSAHLGGAFVLEESAITGNGGEAIFQETPDFSATYRHLTLSNNGVDAIMIHGGSVTRPRDWNMAQAGAPVEIKGSVSVGSSLSLEPGTILHLASGVRLYVAGNFYALGTPSAPITLTAASGLPGGWDGLRIRKNARVLMRFCDVGYGGGDGNALVEIASSRTTLQGCRIHDSAAEGVKVVELARPVLSFNRIEDNVFGLRNSTHGSTLVVDARHNWWGAESGPSHPEANPDGSGNAVGDRVLFDPWLPAPPAEVPVTTQLRLEANGPRAAVPGETVDYVVDYANETGEPIENGVLLIALPNDAEYVSDSGGGIFWRERRQLFWKLGQVEPGAHGVVAVRLRFPWGLPSGSTQSLLGLLSGTNLAPTGLDLAEYLAYNPVVVLAEQPLSAADVEAEWENDAVLDQLYRQALSQGFVFGTASHMTLANDEPLTLIVLLKLEDGAVTYLRRQGTSVLATVVDRTSYVVQDAQGGLEFDFQTDTSTLFGGWANSQRYVVAPAADLDYGTCMQNCILELVPKHIAKNLSKTVSLASKAADCFKAAAGDELAMAKCAQIYKKIPGVSEGIDLGKCNSDCQNDPSSHVCTQNLRQCGCTGFSAFGTCWGAEIVEEIVCDTSTGRYNQIPRWVKQCNTNISFPIEKCVNGECVSCENEEEDSLQRLVAYAAPALAQRVTTPTAPGETASPAATCALLGPDGGACAPFTTRIITARDPNAKYGWDGDVLPGQLLTYTITYENEGDGQAYGVFVVDRLAAHFDESTLALYGPAQYVAASRLIVWDVGELAPKGQVGSSGVVSFTVRLKPGLPSGTVIANQAVVHFPSVPEETPTNPVVNVVQPLVAEGQEIEAVAGRPVTITLRGLDAANSPLSYTVVEEPLYGTLTGSAPALVYTPQLDFSGVDVIQFTVSNGITTSRPAEVRVLVLPSPDDTEPPEVLWTVPRAGGTAEAVAAPHISDTLGPIYLPGIHIRFSEAISEATVAPEHIRLVDEAGQPLSVTLLYDGTVNGLDLLLREPLQEGMEYTATLTRGLHDLRGNPLPADYSWSFRVGAKSSERQLYLPLLRR